jgi:hypothetical protein
MSRDCTNSVRPWQMIASELAKETDDTKVLALMEELQQALEERDKARKAAQ